MKAVIMAGGEGSRLRPLTCGIPKPMARLCGRPVLEYILELLKKHGVTQAALTLRYLPERVTEHFPDGSFADIRLEFVEETEPLGTAGGVRNACTGEEQEILVISGDAMCDFDLTAFIKEHRASGADVTILAKEVDDPREYGLIDTDNRMDIIGFIEKPAWSQAISNLANTGIYLLSGQALQMIPQDRPFDFAKDLFPLMLAQKMKLHCFEGKGYWCDIGDLDSYIRCQQDMLYRKVECEIRGRADAQGNIFAAQTPPGSVRITGPLYIGNHVTFEDGAVLEGGSVIDDGCHIARGAGIAGGILLPDCYVSERARITGALLCPGATVKADAVLSEGVTVGAGAVVGERSVVSAGVRIWNDRHIPPESTVTEHVRSGARNRSFFADDGISGQVGVELTPEFMARLGAAVGSYSPDARIAVGSSIHAGAQVLKAALCAGIRSAGAHVVDFGENFLAQFAFSMNFCALPVGVFVRGDSHAGVRLLCEGGLPATRDMERGIEGMLARGEFNRCAWDGMGDLVEMQGMDAMYRSQLLRCAPQGLSGCSVRVRTNNPSLKSMMREVLHRLGCDVSTGWTLELSSQGDRVRFSDPAHGVIAHHRVFTWCCLSELERGSEIAIPFDAPQSIDMLAEHIGGRVRRYLDCPADASDEVARRLARAQLWPRDALMQAVMFLSLSRRTGGLEGMAARTPGFDMEVRTLSTQGSPAAFLRGINTQRSGGIGEGIRLQDDRGVVLVRPLKRGTGIRILAEAVSVEAANELCDDIEQRLRRIQKESSDQIQQEN